MAQHIKPPEITPSRPESRPERIPKLLRFLAVHFAFGAAIGVAFSALILLSDLSGLKQLILGSDAPLLAAGLLYAMNVLTFASLSMGIGIMTMPLDTLCDMRSRDDRDDGPGGDDPA